MIIILYPSSISARGKHIKIAGSLAAAALRSMEEVEAPDRLIPSERLRSSLFAPENLTNTGKRLNYGEKIIRDICRE